MVGEMARVLGGLDLALSRGNCHVESIVFLDMRIRRQPFSQFRPSRKTCLLILASLFCLLVATGLGQEPIRVNVRLVNVAFSARDSRGALVENLTKDDVEVFEDAVSQKISFFAHSVDVPLTLGLVVDFSGSQDQFSKRHERDLQVFLKDALGPKDRVFLVCFGNHVRLVSDFSQSGAQMMQQLDTYRHDDGHFPELGPKESRDLGTAFYDSIFYSVTEKLANESGRRALLVFSDGEDNSSSHDMMTAIEAAQGANVLVFTIRYTEKKRGKLTARNKYGIRVMDRVAKETGGQHIDAEATDPKTYFRQLAEELRSSYELAYYPSNPIRDDTFRKIAIRPKQAGITVHSRTGYFSRSAD
jgi:Ca-activated chloride channel family protein